jgi:hypothetical protein
MEIEINDKELIDTDLVHLEEACTTSKKCYPSPWSSFKSPKTYT